ncbi:MAG: hypothetical protein AB4290_11475 [Spirulina sp.]
MAFWVIFALFCLFCILQRKIGYWLLVIGYWLLVIGYWLLVIGYWLLPSWSPLLLSPLGLPS